MRPAASSRYVEATDPLGATERIEFQWQTPELPRTVPAAEVPDGFVPRAATTYTYDGYGRMRTVTDVSRRHLRGNRLRPFGRDAVARSAGPMASA